MSSLSRFTAALALACLALGTARADNLPVPQNVVGLSASATVELTRDWLTVVFSTSRDGADAAVVQGQLKQALDVALAEARKLAKPGQVEVQTGNFSLYPRYAQRPGGQPTINGWQGSAELIVEGRDVQAIAQLAGRIQTLTIQRTGFSLSRQAREKVEGEVAALAIQAFRAKAAAHAREFGFAGYTLREVQVSGGEPAQPMQMMRAKAMSDGAAEALPVEAGRANVSANVSGTIVLTR